MRPLTLVVENDPGTRKLLDAVLTRSGSEVDLVTNGIDALHLITTIDYGLTILDLTLPGLAGDRILEWLRAERPAALQRTIVVSSASPARLLDVQRTYPEVRVIRKPFELDEMLAAASELTPIEPRNPLGPADQFVRRSITAGAKAGLLVSSNGLKISLVHNFGYGSIDVENWFPMSCEDPFPLCMAVRDGRAQWLSSLASAGPRFPRLEQVWQASQSLALASVPVMRNGRVIGAAGWSFREPRPFDENEQRAFTAIADEAVTVFENISSAADA